EAAKLAESRVTARLLNVPLGTTIQSLTDQVGLAVFVRHNVFLVTTPEHAKKLKQEQDVIDAQQEVRKQNHDLRLVGFVPFGLWKVYGRIKLVNPTIDEKITIDADKTSLRQLIPNLAVNGFNITIDPAVGK